MFFRLSARLQHQLWLRWKQAGLFCGSSTSAGPSGFRYCASVWNGAWTQPSSSLPHSFSILLNFNSYLISPPPLSTSPPPLHPFRFPSFPAPPTPTHHAPYRFLKNDWSPPLNPPIWRLVSDSISVIDGCPPPSSHGWLTDFHSTSGIRKERIENPFRDTQVLKEGRRLRKGKKRLNSSKLGPFLKPKTRISTSFPTNSSNSSSFSLMTELIRQTSNNQSPSPRPSRHKVTLLKSTKVPVWGQTCGALKRTIQATNNISPIGSLWIWKLGSVVLLAVNRTIVGLYLSHICAFNHSVLKDFLVKCQKTV